MWKSSTPASSCKDHQSTRIHTRGLQGLIEDRVNLGTRVGINTGADRGDLLTTRKPRTSYGHLPRRCNRQRAGEPHSALDCQQPGPSSGPPGAPQENGDPRPAPSAQGDIGANAPEEGVWIPPAETEAYLAWKREQRGKVPMRDPSPTASALSGRRGGRAHQVTLERPQRSPAQGAARTSFLEGDLREVIRLLRDRSRRSPDLDLREVLCWIDNDVRND